MVPVTVDALSIWAAKLVQSIDLAIRDLLLANNADPFALANYLWVISKHGIILVNGDRLADWGASWIRQILIEGRISRRADEEISAAALSALALADTIQASKAQLVADSLKERLAQANEVAEVAFGSPPYAAALLAGASKFGVDDSRTSLAMDHVVKAFEEAIPSGRMLGIAFVAEILTGKSIDAQNKLRHQLGRVLGDPSLGYEDQTYVAQGLCQLGEYQDKTTALSSDEAALVERTLSMAPIWPYLMSAQEEIEPIGDSNVPVVVSHYYRAALLDVVLYLLRDATRRHEATVDAKLRGRTATGFFAFIGIAFTLSLPWMGLAYLLFPSLDLGRKYWLGNEYSAMGTRPALLFFVGVLMFLFLAIWTPMILSSLWKLLVLSGVESDQRVKSVVWSGTRIAFARWIFVSTAILLTLLGDALAYTLGQL